jgi:hypothetical protein
VTDVTDNTLHPQVQIISSNIAGSCIRDDGINTQDVQPKPRKALPPPHLVGLGLVGMYTILMRSEMLA